MIERVFAIARKEMYQIWRDKRSLGLLAFVPVFTLLLFGFVLNLDTKHVRLAVVDEDRSAESRRYVGTFLNTEYFDAVGAGGDSAHAALTRADGDRLIENGTADVVLIVPEGFGADVLAARPANAQAIVNGGNANVATNAAAYVDMFTQNYSAEVALAFAERNGLGAALPIDYRPRVFFNPELKSSRYLVPGLMGFVLTISTVISTALSVVREKERGTIEQMMVSPVSGREFILGKTIPYFVIAVILAALIILAGRYLFDVPVRGDILMLSATLLFFILGGLGLGLAISTVAQTQESAFFIATFATVLPTQLLSGFIFPLENMPVVLRAVTYIVPARYLLAALRAILLKGAPFDAYWGSFVALVVFAILTLGVAVRRLRKSV